MRPSLLFGALACMGAGLTASAAPAGTPVPAATIPPPVVSQLKNLESRFDLALSSDCAPERCFSKGCLYVEHAVVDQPRQASLPGLGTSEGPGSVAPQEYLTQARCEFAHEKSVPARDVQALVKRLEQKLSKGWLVVAVHRETLEPVAAGLREPPVVAPPVVQPPPPAPILPPAPPPPAWELGTALRELWVSLLPHFSWMIALFLVTVSSLTIIWALRRLGRESIEEKALLAQLASGGALPGGAASETAATPPTPEPAAEPPASPKLLAGGDGEDQAFIDEQRALWNDRIAGAGVAQGESGVVDLLREWLAAGEFSLLAKAVFLFGDRLSLASFPADGDLAMRKIEFADYLRNIDEARLPSQGEFFRKLNHHAISSAVLAQSDAAAYRSLREEFGSSGIARLVGELPARPGALLFALVHEDYQQAVARALLPELRKQVAEQLLVSNRIAKDEIAYLFRVLRSARAGERFEAGGHPEGMADRGREFDAAGALSNLLPHLDPAVRSALFGEALAQSQGVFPLWYEEILFADMLLRVPEELQGDVLLDVDIRVLAGWLSVQPLSWQDAFVRKLAPTMQNALKASMAFGSREDQRVLARRGRGELASALQRLVARGRISFAEVVV